MHEIAEELEGRNAIYSEQLWAASTKRLEQRKSEIWAPVGFNLVAHCDALLHTQANPGTGERLDAAVRIPTEHQIHDSVA